MVNPDPSKITAFETPTDLGKWFIKNHATERELWVKIFKRKTGIRSVTWDEVVMESLCWGWIDGLKISIDNQAYLQRVSPRKPRSDWSKRNTEHVERLNNEGRMKEPGLAHVRAAKADGRWARAYSVSEMKVPSDFLAALDDNPKAKRFYETLTKSDRYVISYGLESAKKEITRQSRFQDFMNLLVAEVKPQLGSAKKK